ncbi:CGNR zinc finger domain-containing protein [Streptomyces sp. NPDC088923]|uniref:CGNR zinc finger domain-containing protein n=1 Tax=Streptomyces sp. NPDC088923 TaxID=3365913 RepID=UPI003828814B
MTEQPEEPRWAALSLASTIRHDGDGGVADDLDTLDGLRAWLDEAAPLLPGAPRWEASEALRGEVRALRGAVRALFARGVRPGPVSSADADRLQPADEALALLNATAARVPLRQVLDWPKGAAPAVRLEPDPRTDTLPASLARAALDFLAAPDFARLRACTAPRCVRYFVRRHGRQEWCKPSCGNRARAARHYRRHRGERDGTEGAG